MKIATSCSGRFHIFEQARQLHRHGLLGSFITDYPRFMTRRCALPDEKVVSLLMNGVYSRLAWKVSRKLTPAAASALIRTVHDLFSWRLASHIPEDCNAFIGLSSFCLEAIRRAKEVGMVAIVDHGSFHQGVELALKQEEERIIGLPIGMELPMQWLIDKEDSEFRAADYIMVLSDAARQGMIDAGIPKKKIFVNPCGVDLALFEPGLKKDNTFRVIQCGGITQGKGVYYLIRAFNELRLPNSELWFVGGGAETSAMGPIIEPYRSHDIHFLGSFPQHRLRELYNQCSVSALASIADGFGMVVPQAMACGLPVIVTENVGAADLVSEGNNGFVVPIRDINALKEKLVYLYENPEACVEMGQAARTTVMNGYSWEDYGDRLVQFLQKVCNQ